MRALLLALLILCVPAAASAAPNVIAPTGPAMDRERSLVERLTIERANALAANDARWSAQYSERARRLEAAERALRTAQATSANAQAELARLESEKKALSDEIAAKDQAYAQEIAAYRELMTGVVASAGPEKLTALERYATGDRIGAFPVLQQITEAENAARDRAAAAMDAARRKANADNMRALAAQALDMLQRGELTLDKVLPIWRQVVELDPDTAWGWVELGRLESRGGRIELARAAYERALAKAGNDEDRIAALSGLSDTQIRVNDLAGAAFSIERSVVIAEARAKEAPDNTNLRLNLIVSLTRLSDIQMAQGRSAQARETIVRALFMAVDLYTAHPEDPITVRLVAFAAINGGEKLQRIGEFGAAAQGYAAALKVYEEVIKDQMDQQDRSVLANLRIRRGQLFLDQGDMPHAAEEFQKALVLAEALATSDPGDLGYRILLQDALNRVGDGAKERGDWAAARKAYERGIAVARQSAEISPGDREMQRNLAVAYDKLGAVLLEEGDLDAAEAAFRSGQAIVAPNLQANPRELMPRADNSEFFWRLGQVARKRGDLAAAVTNMARSVDLLLSLNNDQPENRDYLNDIVENARDLGDAQAAAGDRSGAAVSYGRSLQAASYIAGREAANPAAQRDLALTLFQMARDLGGDGAWAKAAAQYEKLAALGPLTAEDKANLERAKREAAR